MKDKFQELTQRPDIDAMTTRYEKMQTELRNRLSTELGPLHWKEQDPMSRAGCSGYSEIRGVESRTLALWVHFGNIPDKNWDRAVAIATEVTGAYGFGPPATRANSPGQHDVIAMDAYGASYTFGTYVNTTLMLHTGCHLEAKAHPANAGKTP
ncbi:LppA family lipoprotein [Allokutzneria sp. A3M-2-11 16]|uniref:LppA family lipoprotein n=1 Tax=Allokutzneria sp. A3M-2-11 16 TaxID=2962043 RepID=UPI0020B6F0E0|nr:LppA family lipoprotein [Allokutzneria sp. A3M-2-11 16]MCP3797771.1 LppA family lipoprotein [Allokutzneria sp. A3M-2-11 16]